MSEDPGEDGRHSVILKLIDAANNTAYEVVKEDGTMTAFPMVQVTFDDAQVVSTDEDGVPSVASVTSMTTVAPSEEGVSSPPPTPTASTPTVTTSSPVSGAPGLVLGAFFNAGLFGAIYFAI